jgi:hypothetical protein
VERLSTGDTPAPLKKLRLSRNWRETPPDMAAVRFAWQIVPPVPVGDSATAGETIPLKTGEPKLKKGRMGVSHPSVNIFYLGKERGEHPSYR